MRILPPQVIVADNYFTGSKDNLKKWIGHPRFELIRHGNFFFTCEIYHSFGIWGIPLDESWPWPSMNSYSFVIMKQCWLIYKFLYWSGFCFKVYPLFIDNLEARHSGMGSILRIVILVIWCLTFKLCSLVYLCDTE